MRSLIAMGLVGAVFGLGGCVVVTDNDVQTTNSYALATDSETHVAINQTLDELHEAASKADEARYFRQFSDDSVFLGTDATERWTKEQFRAYAHPIFSQGKGWTYTMRSRNVYLARDRRTAWFDEVTHNEKLGECRGTGVLVKEGGRWRITQYNLTIPVPNALAEDLVKMIRAQPAGPGK